MHAGLLALTPWAAGIVVVVGLITVAFAAVDMPQGNKAGKKQALTAPQEAEMMSDAERYVKAQQDAVPELVKAAAGLIPAAVTVAKAAQTPGESVPNLIIVLVSAPPVTAAALGLTFLKRRNRTWADACAKWGQEHFSNAVRRIPGATIPGSLLK